MAGDPYYNQVELLLHFEGTDELKTITDSSPSPKTVTCASSYGLGTAQSKFGVSSIRCNPYGVSFVPGTAFKYGTADYTVEFFYYADVAYTSQVALIAQYAAYPTVVGLYLTKDSAHKLRLRVGNNIPIDITGTTALTATAWHHIAICRSSGTTRL